MRVDRSTMKRLELVKLKKKALLPELSLKYFKNKNGRDDEHCAL